jgi:cytochrome c2
MKLFHHELQRAWFLVLLFSLFGVNVHAASADSGIEVFERGVCNACHTIGGGKLVGPDLVGINQRRSREWLVSFIRSPQSVIRSGDVDAIALLDEFDGIVMPDAMISDDEILTILNYIAAQSLGSASDEIAPASENVQAAGVPPAISDGAPIDTAADTAAQITLGQELFQGTVRFANGGPTCNACHDIADDAILAGGILARELTDVFNRMGGPGVQAILGRPPFPVMEAAYADQPLTEQEITALVAVLRYAAETGDQRLPRDYGLGLFTSGVAGAGLIFGSCSLIWRTRKRASVNQSIYDRQIKSS